MKYQCTSDLFLYLRELTLPLSLMTEPCQNTGTLSICTQLSSRFALRESTSESESAHMLSSRATPHCGSVVRRLPKAKHAKKLFRLPRARSPSPPAPPPPPHSAVHHNSETNINETWSDTRNDAALCSVLVRATHKTIHIAAIKAQLLLLHAQQRQRQRTVGHQSQNTVCNRLTKQQQQ